MDKDKSSPTDIEMTALTSSSSSDLKDWDLLDSDIVENKTLKDSTDCDPEQKILNPSGLFSHKVVQPKHSGVEEIIAEEDHVHRTDSNSSSDIDVIDDCIEDNHSNLSIPSLDVSFCVSDISTMSASQVGSRDGLQEEEVNSIGPEPSQPVPPPVQPSLFTNIVTFLRLLVDAAAAFRRDGMSGNEYLVFGVLFSIVVIIPCSHIVLLKTSSWHEDKLAEMEHHIGKLQSENAHLKDKVLAKIESGKLFKELDEEVKDLKVENIKLHKTMHSVFHKLEEQTYVIKKGIEEKMQNNPYKSEIQKLKEQINVLQIDNEELQVQLARIRYGKFSSTHNNAGVGTERKPQEEAQGKSVDEIEKKREEIKKLQKKLNEEVTKLKNWKESLEDFMKDVEGGEILKSDHVDERKDHENNKQKQKKYKNRKFYHWTWKEIKNNFKESLEKFPDVSDMISKYVLFDKKKVDGVFDSVGHYFKKAQDKTRKILELYSVDQKTEVVKNDIWNLMGDLKNKWVEMKNDFMDTHFGAATDVEQNGEPENAVNHQDMVQPSYTAGQKYGDGAHPVRSDVKSTQHPTLDGKKVDMPHVEEPEPNVINMQDKNTKVFVSDLDPEKLSELEATMKSAEELGELLEEAQKMFYLKENGKVISMDSWILERAHHRAYLRSNERENKADLNWFLRRSKQEKELEERDREADLNWFLRKTKEGKDLKEREHEAEDLNWYLRRSKHEEEEAGYIPRYKDVSKED